MRPGNCVTSNTGLNSSGHPISTTVVYADGAQDAIGYTAGVHRPALSVSRPTAPGRPTPIRHAELCSARSFRSRRLLFHDGLQERRQIGLLCRERRPYAGQLHLQHHRPELHHAGPASGHERKVTSVTRTHADGILNSTMVYQQRRQQRDHHSTARHGLKLVETDYHADQSKDVCTYNITGQNYTTEHDTTTPPASSRHSCAVMLTAAWLFKLVQISPVGPRPPIGTMPAAISPARSCKRRTAITPPLLQQRHQDRGLCCECGRQPRQLQLQRDRTELQTQIQHLDVAGKIIAVTRNHADGSLDYTQLINSDGSGSSPTTAQRASSQRDRLPRRSK